MGVDKSTKLSDINLDAIAQFMANKESGTKISTSQSSTNTVNSEYSQIAIDWAERIRDGKAKLSDITSEVEKNNPGLSQIKQNILP